jgi:hypothetical protein
MDAGSIGERNMLWEKYQNMNDHDKLTEIGVQVEIMQTKLTTVCMKTESYGDRITRLETIVAVVAGVVALGLPLIVMFIR